MRHVYAVVPPNHILKWKASTNMNFFARILTTATAALVCFAGAQSASAARVYYLVGVRHVYRIGTDMYSHSTERKQIEQDYADEVSADNAHYQYQISHGANSDTESSGLQSALGDLSTERENRLGALYTRADWVRNNHPALNIQVDGPYQVIGVGYHEDGNAEVWDNYSAYAPWPGYVSEGPNPYGWNYGAVYTPSLFIGAYRGWYGGWIGFGSPAFVGFYGAGGPMIVAGLSVNVGLGFGMGIGFGGFYANAGLGGFYHSGPGYFGHDPYRGRYISNRGDPRAAMAGRAGYAAGASAVSSARSAGYANGIRAGSRSTFARSTTRSGAASERLSGASGYARSASRTGTSRAGGGYAHSAVGTASRTGGGNTTRNNGSRASSVRSGGSASRVGTSRAGSGYAHSAVGTASRTGGGNYGRSSGGNNRAGSVRNNGGGGRSGGGRRGGGNRRG